MMHRRTLLAGLSTMALAGRSALAETPEAKGLRIALESDARDIGFGDYTVEGRMTLKSATGSQTDRVFTMRTLEVLEDGDKRLIVFQSPPDLKGTVSLTFTHGLEPDDQWIYLPSLRRTKRLSSRDKTGAFMGSEFAFEDIGSWEVKKYDYRWLRDDVIDGNEVHVLENTPAYEFSGYSKLENWMDKTILHSRKIVYFDRNGRPLKELHFYDYKQYAGRHWQPDRIVMTNLQNGNVSTIAWSNYRYGQGIAASDMDPTRLDRFAR